MRKVIDKDLVGKTVKAVDSTAVNALVLTFSDDTTLELFAEQAISTIAGTIPGIFTPEQTPTK